MQDIDFDELDRAVNSVISPGTDETSVAVSNQKPSERSVAVPERSEASPAARRSSGRFMDVVHPSSDMRPSTTVPERPAPELPADDPAPAADSFQWPDPLDLQDTSTETDDAPETTPEPPQSQPLESPFLSDAKVEKRPLGGATPPEMPEPHEPTFSDDPQPEPESRSEEESPASLELDEDVLKLEAGETPIEPVEELPTDEAPIVTSTPIVEAPIGPTSITQQYKEQPSTGDQPSGAIYDTEAYHQPLVHSPKKHSGLLLVVWILGLIVIGGGMGAAVYFFVLPML